MPKGDEAVLKAVLELIDAQKLQHAEVDEQWCTKITVKKGATRAYLQVFNTGKISAVGPDSALKELLIKIKEAVETGGYVPGHVLYPEFEQIPKILKSQVPNCDPIIISFLEEALVCVRANAIVAGTFMIGAASERAINLLIEYYGTSITDKTNQAAFFSRVNNRAISKKFEEFLTSYKSCKSRPVGLPWANDIETMLTSAFQFYRLTRNEAGHPEIRPNIERSNVIANLGQFEHYIERIYLLMEHFRTTKVTV